MSGFSINLKGKKVSKKSSNKKAKKVNLFSDKDDLKIKKQTTILLKHVDNSGHDNEDKPLVIKPVPVASLNGIVQNLSSMDNHNSAVKYGLNMTGGSESSHEVSNPEESHPEVINPPDFEKNIMNKYLDQLPEMTTVDEYEEVPIEEFGSALLRGMGWNGKDDEETKNSNHEKKAVLPHLKVRADYAGLGTDVPVDMNLKDGSFMPVRKIRKEVTGSNALGKNK